MFRDYYYSRKVMKKFLIIAVILIFAAPAAAHAFSFVDVINFGERLIHRQTTPSPDDVKKEIVAAPARFATLNAETKFNNWQNAFDKKNVSLALVDNRNLYFTDAEINFLIARELASSSNPAARDVVIYFSDNLAKISGYVMLKSLTGKFYLEAKPAMANNHISFQVTKARFNNFYFPSFLAQSLLSGQLKTSIDFLYSDPNQQNLSLTLGNGFIQLNYGQ
jgi:hypothetical protein